MIAERNLSIVRWPQSLSLIKTSQGTITGQSDYVQLNVGNKLCKKNELLLNLIIDCPYFVSVYEYHLSPRLSGGCIEECYPHPQDGQVAPCCDLPPTDQQEAASTRGLRGPCWRSQLAAAMVLILLVIGKI